MSPKSKLLLCTLFLLGCCLSSWAIDFTQKSPHPVIGYVEYPNGSYPRNLSITGKNTRTGEVIDLDYIGCAYLEDGGYFQLEMGSLKKYFEDGDTILIGIKDAHGTEKTLSVVLNSSKPFDDLGKLILTKKKPKSGLASTVIISLLVIVILIATIIKIKKG